MRRHFPLRLRPRRRHSVLVVSPEPRYHGGANPKRQALSVAALRPTALAEVAHFIEANQPQHDK
jgi:hypothetical protein